MAQKAKQARKSISIPTQSKRNEHRTYFHHGIRFGRHRTFRHADAHGINLGGSPRRQNDIQGQGEITHGNWISGIPFIDNPRLGDQSLLPDELTTGNKGHNVFYFLPLLLGIIGLLWQAFTDKRGIEQF